jgi:hypothetical protein
VKVPEALTDEVVTLKDWLHQIKSIVISKQAERKSGPLANLRAKSDGRVTD